jgi:hypothetical protein
MEKKKGNRMNSMRASSIFLALVVVLVLAQPTKAITIYRDDTLHDFTVHVGGYRIGFEDGIYADDDSEFLWNRIHLGPLGPHSAPCTATQGLIGFGVIVVGLIIVPAVLTVRWKKRRVAK